MENVILVDNNDKQIWTMEKLEAHKKWLLHRAFSLFIFNEKKNFCFSKEQKRNIIADDYGLIQYVPIREN